MILSTKRLALAALVAASGLAPYARAGLASLNMRILPTTGGAMIDGLPISKTVDLAGETMTIVATRGGQVRKVVDSFGKISTATYDANGNLLSRRDAMGAGMDYTYDVLNRQLTMTDAAIIGKVYSYAYDGGNRLASMTDPIGVVTTYGYDLRNRIISESTPMSGTINQLIQYGYDGRGNMTTLTDANNAVTVFVFDSAGRKTSKLYANGDQRTMVYDAAGRLVTLTDENGHAITSAYDIAGRLISKTFASDSTTDTFVYDSASRVISATKGRYGHTLTYAYDAAGRLASELHPDGEVIYYGYDTVNRLANLSISGITTGLTGDAYSIAYAYDGRGQMTSVTSGDYASNYGYRDNGQLASTVDVRVASPSSDILRTDINYDAGVRLTQVSNTAINGDQAGVVYTLGADDQRLTATEETGQKWNYGYDGLKQLVTAHKTDTSAITVPPLDQTYTYDPMGNRSTYTESGTSVAYTKNSANQYTGIISTGSSALTQSPTYDANGNMLSDGVKNYVWDAENQLISVAPVSPGVGDLRADYTYDWRMRRASKVTYAYTATGWVVQKSTTYKYHKWNLIEEVISSGSSVSEVKRYVWGNDLAGNMSGAGGVGGLLSMSHLTIGTATPDIFFYAYDGNGNVRGLVKSNATSPSLSSMSARYAYDGFGREVSIGGVDGGLNEFRFSTKQLDIESGMNYFGRRYYSSSMGRWINRDPIAEEGGLSIYGFVGNNGILGYDKNGLYNCDDFKIDALGAGLGIVELISGMSASYTGGITTGVAKAIADGYTGDNEYSKTISNATRNDVMYQAGAILAVVGTGGEGEGGIPGEPAIPGEPTVPPPAEPVTPPPAKPATPPPAEATCDCPPKTPSSNSNVGSDANPSAKPNGRPTLPDNPDELQDHGYEDVTDPRQRANSNRTTYKNPESGDTIHHDKAEPGEPGHRGEDHYHQDNPNATNSRDQYLDKDGNPTRRGSGPSHLYPGQ